LKIFLSWTNFEQPACWFLILSQLNYFSLEMTDALLVSLQSFSSNQLYYSTPESVRRGVPLFYFPPNSPQPVCAAYLYFIKVQTSTIKLTYCPGIGNKQKANSRMFIKQVLACQLSLLANRNVGPAAPSLFRPVNWLKIGAHVTLLSCLSGYLLFCEPNSLVDTNSVLIGWWHVIIYLI
jgi:hypothetical protein